MGAKELGNEKKKSKNFIVVRQGLCFSSASWARGSTEFPRLPVSDQDTWWSWPVEAQPPKPPGKSPLSLRTSVDTESLVDTEALGNGGAISWEAEWVPA